MIDYQARRAARDAAACALAATHPHLRPVWASKGGPLTTAAHNVRVELRHCFPGVKFAVRISRFSGGNSIDVSWTDGPTVDQVDRILRRYSAGTFDGMTDCYHYERSAWTDAFGDAKYLHATRQYSDRALQSAARTVWARHGLDGEFSAALFRAGAYHMRRVPITGDDVQTLVYREAGRRTWCIGHPLPAAVAPEGAEA